MKKYIKPLFSIYTFKMELPIALGSNLNEEEGEDQFSKRTDHRIIEDDEE